MFAGTTKRKVAVKCAAANDDEDDFGSLTTDARDKKRLREANAVAAEADDDIRPQPKRKKEKEFAWMDSDDEDDKKGGEDAENKESGKDQEEFEVTVESLDTIQSFGRMMLYSEALSKRLRRGKMNLPEIVAACRALARTKFFDGDIFEDLYSEVRNLLRGDKIEAANMGEIMFSLHSLNAYDKRLFSAIARTFKSKVSQLDAQAQRDWHAVFTDFKHTSDEDFVQLLEVPPLLATNPAYRKIRCIHYQRGSCALDKACTYSHDPRAPATLEVNAKEDYWRTGALVMTNNQRSLGQQVYGACKGPVVPPGWNMNMLGATPGAMAGVIPGVVPGIVPGVVPGAMAGVMPGMAAAAGTAAAAASALSSATGTGL